MSGFVWAYLKQRRRVLAAAAAAGLIFAVTFALYQLPLEAVGYPVLICAVLGLVYMAVDLCRCRRRHETLQRLKKNLSVSAEPLPETDVIEAQDYQEMIGLLLQEQEAREARMSRRYDEMIRYYTLWAHQIKTPIASMELQLQSMDDERSRRLSSEVGRIEQYVEMVLAYLRLDGDSTDYVFRKADLDSLVRTAIKRFSGDFIHKKLSVNVQPTHLQVVTDEKWLVFVLEQLLSNAIKYTPKGGVSVYLEQPCTLCIRDTGMGIAPEDLPRLFQNGFTGLNGRQDQQASGLGLHLCRRICAALGYSIAIESELDRGTCVRIDLHRPEQTFE